MAQRKRKPKISNEGLDRLFKLVAEGIEQLHELSEVGNGGRARTLFFALAMYLDDRDIIDHLKAAAMYAAENKALRETDLGPGVQ